MGITFLLCAKEIKQDHALVLSERNQMDIKKFRVMLGHASEETTRKMAGRLKIKLTGQLRACEDCILAKIRRKKIKKFSNLRSEVPGERFLIDVSYIKKNSVGGTNIWLLIKDQATSMKWSMKWSHFMRRKGELIEKVMHFI
jgi:hypothetical protein